MTVLSVLVLLAVAVLAGTYLDGSLVLVPAQAGLSAAGYIENQQANTRLGTIRYRVVLAVVLLTQFAWLAADHHPASVPFLLTSASAGLIIGATVLITIRRVVPINRLVHTWAADQPPADWTTVRARWHRYHHLRTGVVALALVAQAVAIGPISAS